MCNNRVLVVGTTADYIDILSRRYPGRALYVTEPSERSGAYEPAPPEEDEILCDLSDTEAVLRSIRDHLTAWDMAPSGIACYDCESLSLAAIIAGELGLPFVSPEAVAACRNKSLSKDIWRKSGLPTPKSELVSDEIGAIEFMETIGAPVVLKPLTGSGSELVFRCSKREEIEEAFGTIRTRLANHMNFRMYADYAEAFGGIDTRRVCEVEEYIEGEEYSCDFIVDGNRCEIIRIAKKIAAPGHPLGTILAYVLPADIPSAIDPEAFRKQIHRAALALGVERSIVMLDFFVRQEEAVMIEMTPRPGGDCLPPLIRHSCGLDMLGAALDFAEGKRIDIPQASDWKQLCGVRLFASRAGRIDRIDSWDIEADPGVLECYLKRRAGHRVILPPDDYDSRYLGYVVFEPSGRGDITEECLALAGKLDLASGSEAWATSPQK